MTVVKAKSLSCTLTLKQPFQSEVVEIHILEWFLNPKNREQLGWHQRATQCEWSKGNKDEDSVSSL